MLHARIKRTNKHNITIYKKIYIILLYFRLHLAHFEKQTGDCVYLETPQVQGHNNVCLFLLSKRKYCIIEKNSWHC